MPKVSSSKRIDRNRYAKTYPFIIRTPRYSYINDPSIFYETGEMCFSNSDTLVINFISTYTTAPDVLITPKGEDFNVWVESVSALTAVIRSSVVTTGCVSYQVIAIGS